MKKRIFIQIFLINLIFIESKSMLNSSSTFSNNMEISIRQVCVPFTNLQNKPTKNNFNGQYPVLLKDAPEHESQLLFGEYVLFEDKEEKLNNQTWIFVYCLEQFDAKLAPLTGWIKKQDTVKTDYIEKKDIVLTTKNWTTLYSQDNIPLLDIPIGTKTKFISLISKNNIVEHRIKTPNNIITNTYSDKIKLFKQKISKYNNNDISKKIRKNIKNITPIFLNMPYSWGGRTPYSANSYFQTSIDCSGFVNLVYRCCGLAIPRNSGDLYEYCNKLNSGAELETGDFVFLADIETKKINHVLLFLQDQILQESIGSQEPYANRTIEFKDRFCNNKENLNSGEEIGNKIIYFGSILNDIEKIKQISEIFLNCELILANKDNAKIDD